MANERTPSVVTWIALALVVIGAINWGLIGLFDFNLVAAIFGQTSALTRIVYVLVGVSGVYLAVDELVRRPRATTSMRP